MALVAYSISSGPIGRSVYTLGGITAPAMFMPTLIAQTRVNKSNTNTEYSANINYPLTAEVDGVTKATNVIKAHFSFTALRTISSVTEKERVLTELAAWITANKTNIANGNVLAVT